MPEPTSETGEAMRVLVFTPKKAPQQLLSPGVASGSTIGHTEDGIIVIEFDAKTDYIELTPDVAEEFARAILNHVEKAKSMRVRSHQE